MAPALTVYPLDPTGTSPDNKVTGEPHTLPDRILRAVAPNVGGYFAQSMQIVDTVTGLPLTSSQWYYTERLDMPTVQTNQDICLVAVITDPSVSDNILLTYQAIGGMYTGTGQSVVDQFNELPDVERPTGWPNILRNKTEWPQEDLLHDVPLQQGFETTVHALQRLNISLTNGDEDGHEAVRDYAEAEVVRLGSNTQLTIQNLMATHIADPDPHDQYILLSAIGNSISAVRTPHNVTPSDGTLGQIYSSITFVGDQYRALYTVAQQAMQMQLSTTSDFSNAPTVDRTVQQTTNSITVTGTIVTNTRYYWRYRYQSIDGNWSNWSSPTTFVTGSEYVATPTFTSPANGATTQVDSPELMASAFAAVGVVDTQASADWEIWTGPAGTGTRVFASVNDNVNKTNILVTSGLLQVSKTYYARVRYTGAVLGISNWSGDLTIVTPSTYTPSAPGAPYAGGYFVGYIHNALGSDGSPSTAVYALVMAPKASGETILPWSTTVNVAVSNDGVDGHSNTAAVSGNSLFPAAQWAAGLSIGGFTDWYIPSNGEVDLIFRTFKPTTVRNTAAGFGYNTNIVPPGDTYSANVPLQTTIPAFQSGGSEALTTGSTFLSSTITTQSGTPEVLITNFLGIDQAGSYSQAGPNTPNSFVRACRRVLISS